MSDERIGVVGTGYVGTTTAAGLAHLGWDVTAVDVDEACVERLRQGRTELHEPDLEPLLRQGIRAGRLSFDVDIERLAAADIVFVCVPTPATPSGAADLSAVHEVLDSLCETLHPGAIVVLKSTVPVGTTREAAVAAARYGLHVASNPEFLRESHAVYDFLHADRIVVGADDEGVGDRVAKLYRGLESSAVQIVDFESAELAKYASNAFLATKLSFVNELAELCEKVSADIELVGECLGSDPRIGAAFLRPGPGWGGSCLPKDTQALLHVARGKHVSLGVLAAAVAANDAQIDRAVKVLGRAVGRADNSLSGVRVALLGLTFKAGTSDLRDSPALRLAAALSDRGALLCAYDPTVTPEDAPALPLSEAVRVVGDPYDAARDAEAVVVATEWPEFAKLDWPRLGSLARRRLVVDTRNLLDAETLRNDGFTVVRNGR
ncbi:UDP-glucose dehydrogenase family protein [Nocardia blacklockiae]|uniref:UDP-glucose dehydrogenase family protein n=1 Tax=Nocardia blacklockiae TaxID=480036 RepID=UPI001895B3CE|nr:UDP-glucose/GDP-mannose dehydrogenase family protein [Nocardia blacklockiae]MBF6175323.1 UDP-glucose/GDP-mannose dehydrogenase family protein [Nocardia blacklockiae]